MYTLGMRAIQIPFALTRKNRPAYLRSLVSHQAVVSAVRVPDSHSAVSAMLAMLDQASAEVARRLTSSTQPSAKKGRRTLRAKKVTA